MTSFGQRLKELRQEIKLTQEKLAERFFLNKSSISRYEQDKQIPEIDLLEKIADFFDVSIDYLLGRTDIKNIEQDSDNKEKDSSNTLLEDFEDLSEESKKELEKYLQLLKIKDQVAKSKDETSSALEKEA